jgi:hypothetical protein
MKITAKVVPYSSVVGSSVTLHAESGMTICQLSLLSVIPPSFTFTPELHKQTSTRIAEWVARALNNGPAFEAGDQPAAAISTSWPTGCPKRSSCSRNLGCMYGCKAHADRPGDVLKREIEAALADATPGETP